MSTTVTDVKEYQWYAGGQWRDVANGQLFDDFEPYTGNLYARVPNCGAEEARVGRDAHLFPLDAALQRIVDAEALLR